MEGLRDIKDIVEVHEYSLYILIAIVVTSIILISIIIYLFKNRIKRKKRLTPKEIALTELQNIDFSNTKEASYSFSENGYLFVNESNKKAFEEIEEKLIEYKYKRDVANLSEELKEKMKEFIRGIK